MGLELIPTCVGVFSRDCVLRVILPQILAVPYSVTVVPHVCLTKALK